jgi:hypothetical protein
MIGFRMWRYRYKVDLLIPVAFTISDME